MSKATNQSVVLLSVVGGILTRIRNYKMFSAIYMRKHVEETYVKVIWVMNDWPKTGNNDSNLRWIYKKLDKWGEHLGDLNNFRNLGVFASICTRCLSDLESQVKDKEKIKLLVKLKADLEKIHSFVDPEGRNFAHYEKADELMDVLYKIIEWEWK